MSVDILLMRFQGGDAVDFDPAPVDAALARYGVAPGVEEDRIATDDGWVFVSRLHHEHGGAPCLLFNKPSGVLVWEAIYAVATAGGFAVAMPDVSAVCVSSTEVADELAAYADEWGTDVFLVGSASDLLRVLQRDLPPYAQAKF
jgi:hypothetical protein